MRTLDRIIQTVIARTQKPQMVHRPSWEAGFDDASRMWADMLADGVPPEQVAAVMRSSVEDQP